MQPSSIFKFGRLLLTFSKFSIFFLLFLKWNLLSRIKCFCLQLNIMRVNVCLCGNNLCNGLLERESTMNFEDKANRKAWNLYSDIMDSSEDPNGYQGQSLEQPKNETSITNKVTSGYYFNFSLIFSSNSY